MDPIFSVPFIGGLRVGKPMTATVGDQVTPGYSVEVGTGEELGHGIHMTDRGPVAVLSGNLVSNSGVISVDSSAPRINSPKVGDVIIGEVNRLNEKTAELRVLHIETNEGGHRDVPRWLLVQGAVAGRQRERRYLRRGELAAPTSGGGDSRRGRPARPVRWQW